MPWTTTIDPADDSFHERSNDPYWNESSFVTFYVPERKLSGVVYFFFRPNMNMVCWCGPMIWDPSGDQHHTCLYHAMDEYMAIPAGADMFNFTAPNGLSVTTLEPQKRIRYVYDGPGVYTSGACSFELSWEAVMDPHYHGEKQLHDEYTDSGSMIGADPEAALARHRHVSLGHYEQAGRMTGTVIIDGEEIAVDSISLRDHSWGPRETRTNTKRARGTYPWAMVQEADGNLNVWNVYAATPLKVDEDPIFGTTEKVFEGFWLKDGELGRIVSGESRTQRREDGLPTAVTIVATDSLGRTLEAECEFVNRLVWSGAFGDYLAYWCQARWTFDGHTDAVGDVWDYMTYAHWRRFHHGKIPGHQPPIALTARA